MKRKTVTLTVERRWIREHCATCATAHASSCRGTDWRLWAAQRAPVRVDINGDSWSENRHRDQRREWITESSALHLPSCDRTPRGSGGIGLEVIGLITLDQDCYHCYWRLGLLLMIVVYALSISARIMTLDDPEEPLCLFRNSCVLESAMNIWRKIDPHYRRQKCRFQFLTVGFYMDIHEGSVESGCQATVRL